MRKLLTIAATAALTAMVLTGCQNAATSTNQDGTISGFGGKSVKHVKLGQKEYGSQNYGLAEKSFRKSVEVRPDNVNGWLGLAASYDQLGQFKRADRAYDQVLKMSGENVVVLNNKGFSLILRGDVRKGIKMLEKASEMDPDNKLIKGNLQYGYSNQ